MLRKIIKIIMVLLCMITIFMFSSDTGEESQKKSDGMIVRIGEFIIGHHMSSDEKDKVLDYTVFFVRKTAHFTIYLILGFFLISLVLEYRSFDYYSFFIALFIAFLYACSDEVHQLFVMDRSGSFFDVLLDTFGSFVGIGFYSIIYKLRRKKYE